jgi:uncharacterized protein YggL (DUF469 family)
MKKRLRKKNHLVEFKEWGRQLVITRNRKDGFDEFLDAFITSIEANACYCGGGGKEDTLDVIVELGGLTDDRDGRMKSIIAWLAGRSDVQSWKIGDEFDLWNENFE